MLLDDIEKNFPFISVVEYGGQEYVGVINNQDNAITSMFIFTDIRSAENKEKFIELCKTWWFESNRMIPIGIFLRQEMAQFKPIMMMMNNQSSIISQPSIINRRSIGHHLDVIWG